MLRKRTKPTTTVASKPTSTKYYNSKAKRLKPEAFKMEGIRHAWRVFTFSDVPSSSQHDPGSRLNNRRRGRILLHRACSAPPVSDHAHSHLLPYYGVRSVRPGAYQVIRTRGPSRQHRVTIPEGSVPGTQFAVLIGGQEVQVQCPNTLRPGHFVRVTVPGELITRQAFLKMAPLTRNNIEHVTKTKTTSNNDNNSKAAGIIKVMIPPDVRPGMSFVATVQGKRYSVTCPAKVPRSRKVKVLPLFQEIRNVDQKEFQKASDMDAVGTDDPFKDNNAAFTCRLTRHEGKDWRLPAGSLSIVSPSEASLASSSFVEKNAAVSNLDALTIANKRAKPLEEKVEWFRSICKELSGNIEEKCMKLVIRRDHLMEDSIRAVMSLGTEHLRKPWRIEFVHEPGVDSGGVTREWFQLASEQVLSPDNGLWVCSATNQMNLAINPDSGESSSSNTQ
jgi:hypothetical protein